LTRTYLNNSIVNDEAIGSLPTGESCFKNIDLKQPATVSINRRKEMIFRKKPMVVACLLAFAAANSAYAQQSSSLDAKIEALQQQIEALKAQVNAKADISQVKQQIAAAPASNGGSFFERKNSDDVTFLTRGGEVTLYGKLALSAQDVSNGLKAGGGNTPYGNNGYMTGIGSDISYVGFRGFQGVGDGDLKFVYQLETQIDISSTSGTSASINASDNTVKDGLTSRNSFIGISSPEWGAIKIGKTDAPYKSSTDRMNAFSGTLGDYSAIIGNTGGDNRVEFGARLDHSLWYESPSFGGVRVNALFSPGQNRSPANDNIAAGEAGCTGGDNPQSGVSASGGTSSCTDGSYGNAFSTNISYTSGPLYLTAAYEIHKNVNRTSDLGLSTTDPTDIADETAAKVGIQYTFPTKTTVSAIYENMTRNVASDLNYQNERARSGTWLAVTQALSEKDSVSFGWAHANKAKGDAGDHNNPDPVPGSSSYASDNAANMFALMYKRDVDKKLSLYAVAAETRNHQYGHYDLGAGGRSLATDCHDAAIAPGEFNYSGNGTCYAGNNIVGFEVGMSYKF
jgi:predicted porin